MSGLYLSPTELKPMMKRLNIEYIIKWFFFLILASCYLKVNGGENDNTKKKIIEIKLNEDFIFGEGVSDNKEIAYGDALNDLLAFANELKIENAQQEIAISELIPNVETLSYSDGNRFEVIVYIPFKIIIDRSPKKSSEVYKTDISASKENLVEKSSEKEETPISSREDTPQESSLKEGNEMAGGTPSLDTDSSTEIEKFLINQDNFSEIKNFLSDMKQAGKIKATGASESVETVPTDASMIIIDGMGGLLAFLSPEISGSRMNYKTLKEDSVGNYKSKFIVWYKK